MKEKHIRAGDDSSQNNGQSDGQTAIGETPARYHDRYSRQILFNHIGEEGQQRLNQSKVLIVGMGALGTVAANHLVRAGVGHVRFVDRDFVEFSNLQRQTLFDEEDAQQYLPKAVAAERKLRRINSDVKVEGIVGDVNPSNIEKYADGVALILDGTDNFRIRFLMNDTAFKLGIPFIYGGGVSSRGMQATFIPNETLCLRCLIGEGAGSGETCDTVGVLASVTNIIASYQATEALKWLVGKRGAIRKSLLSLDLWSGAQQDIRFGPAKKDCPTCQQHEFPALQQTDDEITSLCGRETIQISARSGTRWDLEEWKQKLERVGSVEHTPFLLRFHVDGLQLVLFPDGRVMVQGTEDVTLAKSVYAKYIGM